jgi:tetratricopeptide (TPR) repeat protein
VIDKSSNKEPSPSRTNNSGGGTLFGATGSDDRGGQVVYRHELVEQHYRRVLLEKETALGPDDPEVAKALYHLALSLPSRDEALEVLERAVVIQENSLASDDTELARTLDYLGFRYFWKRRYDRAEMLLVRALAIREKSLEAHELDLIGTLKNLAQVFKALGKLEEAASLIDRALSSSGVWGRDTLLLGRTHLELAEVRRAQGRADEADVLLKRGRLLIDSSPPQHLKPGNVQITRTSRKSSLLTRLARLIGFAKKP